MKTKNIILSALLFLPISLFSQNFADGYMISQNIYMGTGRATAMGSAFGALGADISSVSINPGGLGLYRSSEFTFTPVVSFGKVSSKYYGTSSDDTKFRMNFNNIGYVFTGKTGNSDGLVTFSIAFGYNRLNDLRNNFNIVGKNPYSTISDFFYADAMNNSSLFNYQGRLADSTYLDLYNYNGMNPNTFDQTKKIERLGQKGETFLSFGGNISNMLYFGMSVGYEYFNLTENISYTEYTNYPSTYFPSDLDVQRISFDETYKLNGSGFNVKAGFIFRPIDFLRIGGAIHSPTGYNMLRTYNTYMETQWYVPDAYGNNTYWAYPMNSNGNQIPADELRFRLRTPMRAIGSVGVTLFKTLAFDVDYEYVDYSSMIFKTSTRDSYTTFDVQNTQVKDYMKATHNLRAGAEIKLGDFYIRGGGGYYMNPYRDVDNGTNQYVVNNRSYPTITMSGGIGFRSGGFIFDIGYMRYTSKENVFLYDAATLTEPAQLAYASNRITTTIGFKF